MNRTSAQVGNGPHQGDRPDQTAEGRDQAPIGGNAVVG
jgi:hypothetical protein